MKIEDLLQAIRHELIKGGNQLALLKGKLENEITWSKASQRAAFQAAVVALERADTFVTNPDAALAEYAFAAEVLDTFGEEHRVNYAAVLGNIGVIWQDKGDLDEALRFQTLAREIKEHFSPNSLTMASTYGNIGNIWREKGDLDEALRFQTFAREIQEPLAPNSLTVANTYGNIGNIWREKSDLDEALRFQTLAREIKEHFAPNSLVLATTYGNIGTIWQDSGDLDEALRFQTLAREIKEHLSPDSLALARTYGNIGIICKLKGDLDEALRFQVLSREIEERIAPNSLALASTYGNIGNIWLTKGEKTSAEDQYSQALVIYELFAPGSAYHLLTIQNLIRLSENPAALGELRSKAWSAIRVAAGRMARSEERVAFLEKHRHFAIGLAAQALEDEHSAQALEILEQLRGYSLLLDLGAQKLDDTSEITDLRREMQTLQMQMSAHLHQGELSDDDQKELRRLREREYSLSLTLGKHLDALGLPPIAEPADWPKLIGEDSVYLSYAYIDDAYRLFAVSGDDISVHQLKATPQEIANELNAIHAHCAAIGRKTDPVPDKEETWHAFGTRLADLLLPQGVRDRIEQSRLIVFNPEGFLWQVPFSILIPDPKAAKPYIGLRKQVVTVQSLSIFRRCREIAGQPSTSKGAAVAGINQFGQLPWIDNLLPDPEEGNESEGREVREVVRMRLSNLQIAEWEAGAVANIYGSQALTGPAATKQAFLDSANEAAVGHLASHGFTSDKLASRVAVILHPMDPSGLMTHEDVRGRKLKARLVSMGCCLSGLGLSTFNEGLRGLTYGFISSGVPAVMGALWPVSDRSTADFMTRLHSRFATGVTAGEAQISAALGMSQEGLTPYHWAGFSLVGDPTSHI